MLDKEVYVVGYPNSGRTWLCYLLAYCFKAKYIDLDALDTPVAQEKNYNKALHGINYPKTNLQILKTHQLTIPNQNNQAVIYVVRDVRDIVMSDYLHQVALKRKPTKKKIQSNILLKATTKLIDTMDTLMEDATLSVLIQQHGINWSNHVKVWLQRKPAAIVRYEDLLAIPDEVIASLMLHLGMNASSEAVREAIETFSDSRLSNSGSGDKDRPVMLDYVASGKWQKKFSTTHNRDIQQMSAPFLNMLGYDV
jgi:hypothetical protein